MPKWYIQNHYNTLPPKIKAAEVVCRKKSDLPGHHTVHRKHRKGKAAQHQQYPAEFCAADIPLRGIGAAVGFPAFRDLPYVFGFEEAGQPAGDHSRCT